MQVVLCLCVLLGLLRWLDALPTTGCARASFGPGAISEIRCVGDRWSPASEEVDCAVKEEDGLVHRTRLRLSGWGGPLGAQLLGDKPRPVKQLELSGTALSSLPEALFAGLGSAQLLRLDDNRLSAVPEAALATLPRLQTLTMNGNRIGRLARGRLGAAPCLRHLSLAANGLRQLEQGALPAGLRHLSLTDNQLHTLNGTVSSPDCSVCRSQLTSLRWLFVSNNQLASLRGQLPEGGQLTSLMAYDNRLESVDGLQEVTGLDRLSLGSNRLRSIGHLRLHRLSRLDVSRNLIDQVGQRGSRVSRNLIDQVGQRGSRGDLLELPDVSRNLIDQVGQRGSRGDLLELPDVSRNLIDQVGQRGSRGDLLELLDVSRNLIDQVGQRGSRTDLLELHVSRNLIDQLSVDQLQGLPALKELNLDGNQLRQLGPILTVLPALTKLNLSHNQLSSVAELAPDRHQSRVFSHSLRELFAVGNRITSVGQLNLPKLVKLNLSNNQLVELSAANFAGLPSLEVLALSGNRLQRIGQLLEALPALVSADLSDNSLTSVTPLSPREQLPHESKPRLLHLQTLLLNNNRLQQLDVSLHRLPALCVLDVRNNTVIRLRWHSHPDWRCSLQHRKLRATGNPVHCGDQEVRHSLRQAAINFTVDLPLCGGVSAAAPVGSG
ncbi:Protein artichoke [Amphibalanus amphitrite]|uniref:Protein artichoke n=1 Tax=Amphibalanus amphitrite TaxID=1232801 RepID=A0A6A4W2D1_AMPAM|nr:Protein artichoke [Amphibalanus amphitrite]